MTPRHDEPNELTSSNENDDNHNKNNNNLNKSQGKKISVGSDSVSGVGDIYSRNLTSSSSGRGSASGWTICPLCPPKRNNQKKYALGRGIASHLHAVHTPWKAHESKRQRKLREGGQKRYINELRRQQRKRKLSEHQEETGDKSKEVDNDIDNREIGNTWKKEIDVELKDGKEKTTKQVKAPTPEQIREWNERVVQITAQVEQEFLAQQQQSDAPTNQISSSSLPQQPPTKKRRRNNNHNEPKNATTTTKNDNYIPAGYDRNGNQTSSYQDSLPIFLKFASDGDLDGLRQHVVQQQQQQQQQ
uniref:Uncharacterized protein n=1 Tax=Ditylum brightwellii TaxID=49249 RepID=A0A7S1YPW4_9STRA